MGAGDSSPSLGILDAQVPQRETRPTHFISSGVIGHPLRWTPTVTQLSRGTKYQSDRPLEGLYRTPHPTARSRGLPPTDRHTLRRATQCSCRKATPQSASGPKRVRTVYWKFLFFGTGVSAYAQPD